jgi:hypothetical protein
MSKNQWIHMALTFSLLGGLLANCGGQAQKFPLTTPPPSPPSPSLNLVSTPLDDTLQFRVVEASDSDPTQPDPQRNLDTTTELDDSVLEGNTLVFLNNLHLPDPTTSSSSVSNPKKEPKKQLFLVWPDQLFGSTIRTATYTHQALTPTFKRIPNAGSGPTQAWHDVKNNRWHIPLSELFNKGGSYTSNSVELAHIQSLHLDLVPQLGPNQSFEIQFHILPPLPTLTLQAVTLNPPSVAATLATTFTTQGSEIHQERITNPTQRTLKLWIKAWSNAGKLKIVNYLNIHHDMPTYFMQADPNFSAFLDSHQRVSEGQARIQSLLATHEDGTPESFSLNPGQWISVALRPSEKLNLSWRAGPTPSTPICKIPPTQSHSYVRNSPLHILPIILTIQMSWDIVSTKIVGDWEREIRVSHDFIPPEFATGVLPSGLASTRISSSDLDSSEVQIGTVTSQLQSGTDLPKAIPFSCAGTFQ